MSAHIEISFIERKRLYHGGKSIQNFSNSRGFTPIDIKPCRQHDQLGTTLQSHEGGHCRANTELACFIIAGGKDSASIARAAHSHWPAAQSRSIAHLDRGIK